ncbi:mandelate racemase/muconate lactonizing enzyme family protein [Microlunatus soli]|uniref:D-galactarolactone cycloisomerase n=1 Tax=Microlunatus soli TaxID=630515 RepID=A0A1H1R1Z3_9ACTN|nr:mandelate racemase/muconate lactonizing enzyme family protein [Microlunatus soli]SDS29804.1 D-galactarolactone cycloisomerase [Microlunatus soli]
MKITEIRTTLLTGPCTDDPWLSVFKQSRTAAFVELVTDVGETGVGETYLGYFFPEAVAPVVDYIRPILTAPTFAAAEEIDVTALTARMRTCIAYWGRTGLGAGALAGVEAALWDLKGRLLGVPAHALLRSEVPTPGGAVDDGAAPDALPCYATGGPTPWPIDDLLAKADFYLGLGFDAFKVSSGYVEQSSRRERSIAPQRAAEEEAAKLSRLREHVGNDVGIMLDGHMGHREGEGRWDVAVAAQVLSAIEPYDVGFFEEPLPYDDLDAYARLTAAVSVPVAGGEQLASYGEFDLLADRRALSVAQPDAAWLGPGDFVRVARRFAALGSRVAPHAWGAGGAVMQNVHVAFASPALQTVELPPAAGPLHREIWRDGLAVVDGKVQRPDAPGFGVRLTDELRSRYPFRPGAEEFSSVPGKLMRS